LLVKHYQSFTPKLRLYLKVKVMCAGKVVSFGVLVLTSSFHKYPDYLLCLQWFVYSINWDVLYDLIRDVFISLIAIVNHGS
jgi:hypothetical protein